MQERRSVLVEIRGGKRKSTVKNGNPSWVLLISLVLFCWTQPVCAIPCSVSVSLFLFLCFWVKWIATIFSIFIFLFPRKHRKTIMVTGHVTATWLFNASLLSFLFVLCPTSQVNDRHWRCPRVRMYVRKCNVCLLPENSNLYVFLFFFFNTLSLPQHLFILLFRTKHDRENKKVNIFY